MKQHLCIMSDLFCWGSIGSQTTTTSTSTSTTTTSTSLPLSTTQALLQNHGLLSPRWAICIAEVTTLGKIAGMGCGTAAAWQMLCFSLSGCLKQQVNYSAAEFGRLRTVPFDVHKKLPCCACSKEWTSSNLSHGSTAIARKHGCMWICD